MKSAIPRIGLVSALAAAATATQGQVTHLGDSPRPFSVVPPRGWLPGKTVTGNTRVAFSSPVDLPNGECSVAAVEFKGRRLTQAEIDKSLAEPATTKDVQAVLGRSYNNVKVLSTGNSLLAGFKAQVFKAEYSVGTPKGELWAVLVATTAVVEPNASWTVSCGATGKTIAEARRAFSYWQMDVNAFPTNFNFR